MDEYHEETEGQSMLPPEDIANQSLCNDSEKNNKNTISVKYTDYYKWMGRVSEVRPISVTEKLDWSNMSWFNRVVWWIQTFVQMITLTILSLRTDRLLDWNGYLKYHWKHYLGMKTLILIRTYSMDILLRFPYLYLL